MLESNYSTLTVRPELLQAIRKMGFDIMTEIQQKAIPVMMNGTDIIAKAPTGTGKTCAFGIPILDKINLQLRKPQSIILAPTRELATQICDDLRNLAEFLPEVFITVLYGGQPIEKQIDQLKKGPQILVATPGRLLDHLVHHTVNLENVKVAVLDEADRMLDMGFFKDVRKILDSLKNMQQLCMFSATISREVMDIGWLYQRDAQEITVLPLEGSEPKIEQYSIQCIGREKINIIESLIKKDNIKRAIVFCNTKYITSMVSEQLSSRGFNSDCLHGDMRQSERDKIMELYKLGKIDFLVATDVAARGIDVNDIEVVFNYDIPQENDAYMHRIGRTGRAKREGTSYLLYSQEEKNRLDSIVRYTKSKISPITLMCETNLKK